MTIYRVREQVVPLLVCIHASKVLQVFSVSRFTVNKKDQSELVGSAPGRSVASVNVHARQCRRIVKGDPFPTYSYGRGVVRVVVV